jgi:hypothetical protein
VIVGRDADLDPIPDELEIKPSEGRRLRTTACWVRIAPYFLMEALFNRTGDFSTGTRKYGSVLIWMPRALTLAFSFSASAACSAFSPK